MRKACGIILLSMLMYLGAQSQVIRGPVITCIDNLIGNNNVRITWQPTNEPCGPFLRYEIWTSQTESGPFTFLAQFNNEATNSHLDIGALVFSSTWYYYMVAYYDCPGSTSIPSDTFCNIEPTTAEIERVTVENGRAVIYWRQSDIPQTNFYTTNYHLGTNTFDVFDTASGGRADTVLIDSVQRFDPNMDSVSFVVQGFDSCGNNQGNPILSNSPHRTVYCWSFLDSCEREIILRWSEYINWNDPVNPGVDRYEVWYKRNNSPWFRDGFVDSLTLTYTFTTFSDFDDVFFFIKAVSNESDSIYSNSNVVQVYAEIVQPPTFFYMHQLTVVDSVIQIGAIIDTFSDIARFQIWRGNDSNSVTKVADVTVDSGYGQELLFIDSTVNPILGPYWYEIRALDVCGRTFRTGFGQYMKLRANQTDFFQNLLQWNPFLINRQVLEELRIYRDVGFGLELYRILSPEDLELLDDISELFNLRGEFCYMVEAQYSVFPQFFGPPQLNLVTRSNLRCVEERPVVYIPNAFVPEGLNNVFKPTMIFSDLSNYTMKIFSKEGKFLFQTFDPNEGWDGNHNGQKMPSGGYAYHIRLRAIDGRDIEETGIFILIR